MDLDIEELLDRKSTRLNSSHITISYAVFCLKKKKLVGPAGMAAVRTAQMGPLAQLPPRPRHAPPPAAPPPRRNLLPWRCPPPPFFFNDTATTEIYTLSLHDALPI